MSEIPLRTTTELVSPLLRPSLLLGKRLHRLILTSRLLFRLRLVILRSPLRVLYPLLSQTMELWGRVATHLQSNIRTLETELVIGQYRELVVLVSRSRLRYRLRPLHGRSQD